MVKHLSAMQADTSGANPAVAARAESMAAPTVSELRARGSAGDPAAASVPPSAPLSPAAPANGPGSASGVAAGVGPAGEPAGAGALAPAGAPALASGPSPAPFPGTESAGEPAPASQPPSRAPSRAPSPAGKSAGAAASAGGSGAGAAGLARPQSTGALRVRPACMRPLRVFFAGSCLLVSGWRPARLCGGALGLRWGRPTYPAAQASARMEARCRGMHVPASPAAADSSPGRQLCCSALAAMQCASSRMILRRPDACVARGGAARGRRQRLRGR